MIPTTTTVRYICRACSYRWSQDRKAAGVLVMDRPISVPSCRACPTPAK